MLGRTFGFAFFLRTAEAQRTQRKRENLIHIKSVSIGIIPLSSPSALSASLRFFNHLDTTGLDIRWKAVTLKVWME